MRAILFILIVVVVGLLIAVATGFLNISQTRPAEVPAIDASRDGVTATGGQTPAFDVETGSVAVGSTRANVVVPTVSVNPPGGETNVQADATANSAQ